MDREQGGANFIDANGVKMHSLFTLSGLLNTLKEANKIDEVMVQSVAKFIASSQIKSDGTICLEDAKIGKFHDHTIYLKIICVAKIYSKNFRKQFRSNANEF